MPVPTELEAERVPASPSDGAPASPAETASSGNEDPTSPTPGRESQTELERGGEEKPAKIFLGGLSWQTSDNTLSQFFETNFGEVLECHIMRDQTTKKSRGFGFITFKKAETVDMVLEAHCQDPIYIDDKLIDPKIAVPPKKVNNRAHVKRIFVGGLSSETTEYDLKDYFEHFGTVTEAQLMYDRNTNRHRGFGFVSFEDEQPAEKVCSIQFHDICGKKVEVKVAQTKEQMQGRLRPPLNRQAAPNFSFPVAASFGPYYPGGYHYEYGMGFMPGPGPGHMSYPMKMNRPRRDYGPAYYGGFIERAPPPGTIPSYYPQDPGSYGGIPIPQMIRSQHFVDPIHVMHNMDYMTDQFRGMTMNSSYIGGRGAGSDAHSPPYTQNITGYDTNNSGYDPSNGSPPGNGAYSPTNVSPTGSVNGYSQVPAFTGSPPDSYASSY